MRTTSKRHSHIIAYVVIGIVLLLLAVYFGFAAFFRSHYYFHTSVGDIHCGGKTADYVEEINARNANDYLLTIFDREENKFHLTGKDFSYEYISTNEEQQFLEDQNPFLWPASLFNNYKYELKTSASYDKEALTSQIHQLEFMTADYCNAPVNAYIKLTDDGYEIVPEESGNTPIPEQIVKEISDAVDAQQTTVTLSDDCYKKPEITADAPSIVDTASQLDCYLSSTIHYEIEGVTEELGRDKILGMLNIGEDGTVSVKEDKVDSYVQYLASTYNTYGDPREFKTTQGDTLEVAGGDYGWVISKSEEKAEILKDLESGAPTTREPMYEQTALFPGPNDIGDTYVELDYSNQHMYYYKEGSLIFDSDIVSGKLSNGNGSPDGIYKIIYKKSPSVLVGETYETTVAYFVPFAYNIGFHDATWQSSFGGDRYLTHGSHGCINMPLDKAAEFYDLIEKGTPVVAYYRTPVELTSESAQISNAHSYVDKSKEE